MLRDDCRLWHWVQSQSDVAARSVEEASLSSAHERGSSGEVFSFARIRNGATTRPPKADPSLSDKEVLEAHRAVIRRRTPTKLILLSHEPSRRRCWRPPPPPPSVTSRSARASISRFRSAAKKATSSTAHNNAREALGRQLAEGHERQLLEARRLFGPRTSRRGHRGLRN